MQEISQLAVKMKSRALLYVETVANMKVYRRYAWRSLGVQLSFLNLSVRNVNGKKSSKYGFLLIILHDVCLKFPASNLCYTQLTSLTSEKAKKSVPQSCLSE